MINTKTYEELVEHLLLQNDELLVLTAENRAAIRNLAPKMDKRFIDFGISEMTMIGAAAGLALRGRKPVTHALATFLTLRAYEFVRTDVGMPSLPVKLVGGVPGFLSEANGPTHQAVEDVGIMRSIPPMNIFCPADNTDMLIGLEKVFLSDNPFYIRFNSIPSLYNHEKNFDIGKAEIIGNGTDIAFITYGYMFSETYKAMELLRKEGLQCRLLNLRTPKPVDEEAILSAAKECSLLVTIEDHFLTGGLYSIIAELFLRNTITNTVLPIALENRWFKPALLQDVLDYEGFSSKQIANKVLLALDNTVEHELQHSH